MTSFAVAPNAPKTVDAACDRFVDLTVRLAELKQEIRDAERAVIEAKAADIQAAADEYAAGRAPKDVAARERKAHQAVGLLAARVPGLEGAIDQVGDALAAAIDSERAGWLQTEHEQLEADHADYMTAIAAAQDAASRIASRRSVLRWLTAFEFERRDSDGAVLAPDGYSGADTVRVNDTSAIDANNSDRLDGLLAAAATLTAEPPPPVGPRTLVVARS